MIHNYTLYHIQIENGEMNQSQRPPFTEVSSLETLCKYILNDDRGHVGKTYVINAEMDYTMLHSTIIHAYNYPALFQDMLKSVIETNTEYERFNWFLTYLENDPNYIETIKCSAKEVYNSETPEQHIKRSLDFIFILSIWLHIHH